RRRAKPWRACAAPQRGPSWSGSGFRRQSTCAKCARSQTGWWSAVRWWTWFTSTAPIRACRRSSRNALRSWRRRRTAAEPAGFFVAVLLAAARSATANPETLSPAHWAYAELEHFEARGWIHLPGARPYSRTQVRRWVLALQAHESDFGAGESERFARLDA